MEALSKRDLQQGFFCVKGCVVMRILLHYVDDDMEFVASAKMSKQGHRNRRTKALALQGRCRISKKPKGWTGQKDPRQQALKAVEVLQESVRRVTHVADFAEMFAVLH